MTAHRMKRAITGLQWTLGVVILIESILFLMPDARHDFAQTHMPDVVRLILGWAEVFGATLLLIPQTVVRGAWALIIVFVLAIGIHVLHGAFGVGSLFIYIAAAWTVAVGKAAAGQSHNSGA